MGAKLLLQPYDTHAVQTALTRRVLSWPALQRDCTRKHRSSRRAARYATTTVRSAANSLCNAPEDLLRVPSTHDEALVLLEQLQHSMAALGTPDGINVVALSGGCGSALAAYLAEAVWQERAVACVGRTPGQDPRHLERARYVAELLGMDLLELDVPVAVPPPSRAEVLGHLGQGLAALGLAGRVALLDGCCADSPGRGPVPGLHCASVLAHLPLETVRTLARVAGLPVWQERQEAGLLVNGLVYTSLGLQGPWPISEQVSRLAPLTAAR